MNKLEIKHSLLKFAKEETPWNLETIKEAKAKLEKLIEVYGDVETVASLRKKGYRVSVYHTRERGYPKLEDKYLGVIKPKGGKTEVKVISPRGIEARGVANCSKLDNYDKKEGVRIALKRALDNLAVKEEASDKRIKTYVDSMQEAKEIYRKQMEAGYPKPEPAQIFIDVMNGNYLKRDENQFFKAFLLDNFIS